MILAISPPEIALKSQSRDPDDCARMLEKHLSLRFFVSEGDPDEGIQAAGPHGEAICEKKGAARRPASDFHIL